MLNLPMLEKHMEQIVKMSNKLNEDIRNEVIKGIEARIVLDDMISIAYKSRHDLLITFKIMGGLDEETKEMSRKLISWSNEVMFILKDADVTLGDLDIDDSDMGNSMEEVIELMSKMKSNKNPMPSDNCEECEDKEDCDLYKGVDGRKLN